MRLLGTVLVVVGLLLVIYGGVTLFVPSGEHWLGSELSITVHENLVIPLPPIVGFLFVIVGIVMIMNAPVRVLPPPPPY